MTQPKRSPTPAGGYILVGSVLVALAVLIPMSGNAGAPELVISLLMLVIGGLLLLIGVIAAGVRIGMRNHDANLRPPPDESP
ncbi:MAG TPA: hypothetical protein VEX15_04580 [Nocardioidaceae bacterium]|nr:hypothetical protein [Nocardioidaceae bacterium]